MTRRMALIAGLVLLAGFIVVSCVSVLGADRDEDLEGRMLLWHTWTGADAEALTEVLEAFVELHPDVVVEQHSFASLDELQLQFEFAAYAGFGPDAFIAPADWLRTLVDARLVDPVGSRVGADVLARYMPASLAMLELNGTLYGIPQSLDVPALYFNRRLVDAPATTLDELLVQAREGQVVLLPTNFRDAYWGVQAFGGRLFGNEGQVILGQGGFANWLAWLRDAREVQGMILDNNRNALRARFLAGDAGYYVGYASELSSIADALGTDQVGVAPLPTGPIGGAGPFLGVNAFYFSTVSSPNQRRLALELATFVTNQEQSGYLMRQARQIPANTRVRINPRLNPIVASFATQARAAIAVPNMEVMSTIAALGTDAYNRVLEGGAPPAEVAFETANAVYELLGLAAVEAPKPGCPGLGTARLVHHWDGLRAEALEELTARFRADCPLSIVSTTSVAGDDVRLRLTDNSFQGLLPTAALGPRHWLVPLLEEPPLPLNLAPVVTAEELQKFVPAAVDAMRVQGNLFGMPVGLEVNALFYNRQWVADPAQVLEELRNQASQGVPVALPVGMEEAFWGIGAFGGQLFDEEFRVVLDEGGLAEWLAWLRESRDGHGIRLTPDREELRRWFLQGETAYYIGGSDELAEIQQALGSENVGVALLPSGPLGPAQPLITAQGFYFRASAPETVRAIALDFARYATQIDSQAYLAATTGLLPANATVELSAVPELETFREQLRTGVLLPNTPHWQAVEQFGDVVFRAVLEEGQDPVAVAAEVTRLINEANAIAPRPTATISPTAALEATVQATVEVTTPVTATADPIVSPSATTVTATTVMTATPDVAVPTPADAVSTPDASP